MRPESIRWFERVYWLNIALTAASLAWAFARPDQLAASHDSAATPAILSSAILVEGAVSIGIKLVLWFFITRRASGVARWFFVLFVGLAIVTGLYNLSRYQAGVILGIWIWIAAIDLALRLICLFLLFRADSRAWFRGVKSGEQLADTFS